MLTLSMLNFALWATIIVGWVGFLIIAVSLVMDAVAAASNRRRSLIDDTAGMKPAARGPQ